MLTINESIQEYLNQNGIKETDNDINNILYKSLYNQDLRKFNCVLKYAIKNCITLDINGRMNSGNYPFVLVVSHNNTEITQLLIDYARKYHIILDINRKDRNGKYPLLWSVGHGNIKITKLLMDYASQNNIILDINGRDHQGNYPFFYSTVNNNIEMTELLMKYVISNNIKILDFDNISHGEFSSLVWSIKLNSMKLTLFLIHYSKINHIVLKINEKDNFGNYPLLWTICRNKIRTMELLMEYANENNVVLKINEKNNNGNYPLLYSIYSNNIKMTKLLMNFANGHGIILKIDEKDNQGNYPLLGCINNNNIEMTKLLVDYADDHYIVLKINDKDDRGNYPLLWSITNNNMEITKLLINYANKNNIILKIDEKDSQGNYPLLWSINNNNVEITKLLIDYARNHNIILKIDEKDSQGNCPLLWSINNNNMKITKLLIDYANDHNIILEINEKDFKKLNESNSKGSSVKSISEIDIEIIKLLYKGYIENKINILCDNNVDSDGNDDQSEILKLFDKVKDDIIKMGIINNYYSLIKSIESNNIKMLKELITYVIKHDDLKNQLDSINCDILNISEKDLNNSYLLLWIIAHNNIKMMKELLIYTNKKNEVLNINKKDNNNNYPLLWSVVNDNIEIIELLINYATENNIILEINEKNNDGLSPILCSVLNNNVEILKLLMNYASKNNIILKINEKTDEGDYLLMNAISNNYTEIAKLLTNYATENIIDININEKYQNGDYPLLLSVINNNLEMVQLLIDYANKNNIILKVNDKNNTGNYPLVCSIVTNNVKITKLLIDYASNNNIILSIFDQDVENMINNINIDSIESTDKIDIEILKILKNSIIKRKINILFNYDIKMVKLFEMIQEDNFNLKSIQNNNNNSNNNNLQLPTTPTLVIATNRFSANKYDQLDIEAGEILIVTDWNCGGDWVDGYRISDEEEKGKFPKALVKICDNKNKELKALSKDIITPEYKLMYERKVAQLRCQDSMKIGDEFTSILLDRTKLFYYAYQKIMNLKPLKLKNKLSITYKGEEGIDCYGGILRDFFLSISKEIGDPNYALFQYSNNNSYELVINPLSSVVEPNHLEYYRFVGRIMGLVIFHRQHLPIHFSLMFYKRLLEIPLALEDLKILDSEVYKNLKWLKENEGVENLFLTFTYDTEDSFGVKENVELKPNGANIAVTDFNKDEYIQLIAKYKFNNTKDKEQFNAIKQGFYEIIPKELLSSFSEYDLKYLLVGNNEIDVDDWESNTYYEGYHKEDITIINFWKCVRDFDNENRTKLLIFATGNSQVPVTGFKDLQGNDGIMHFKIKRHGNLNDLPKSHTCFNCIELPPYTSYTKLKQKLLRVITEGIDSFSLL